jgi:hypothetical protein
MKDHIATASAGWNRSEPRFVLIQAQPWTDVKPTNFKNVAASLNDDYVVVRPDHLFQLLREAENIGVTATALARIDSAAIITRDTKLSAFPNPASDQLFITGVKPGSDLNVYDLTGRLLITKQKWSTSNTALDISALEPGTYVLKVNGNKPTTIKFVKRNDQH